MADWYYDYNNVDSSQVNSMLNDIGIDNLYQFIDSYRHPNEFVYATPYEHRLTSVDHTEWNDSPEYDYTEETDDYDQYEDDYNPNEETNDSRSSSPLPLAPLTRLNLSSRSSSPELNSKPDDVKRTLEIIEKYDRNGDGKIAADDIEAILKDLGVGVLSSKLAEVLFDLVDQNKNGVLDPPEVLALASIMDKLHVKAASPVPE